MKLQKETKGAVSHGKWYSDACGTAFALEVLGERWSMLVVRELMLGPRRFSAIRAALPGISAKVLTERLETLAEWGVLDKIPAAAACLGASLRTDRMGLCGGPRAQRTGPLGGAFVPT